MKSLFGIPIYQTDVENISNIQEELKTSVSNQNFTHHPSWGETLYLSDPSFSKNVISDDNLVNFKIELFKHVELYYMDTPFFGHGYQIQNSWFTLMKEHCYIHTHNHGRSDISGVYYYKTYGIDSKLFFQSPHQWSDRFIIEPKVGKLILFPSWLQHGVMTHNTNEKRISLSFNIIFDRI